jgi:hypothetical protein
MQKARAIVTGVAIQTFVAAGIPGKYFGIRGDGQQRQPSPTSFAGQLRKTIISIAFHVTSIVWTGTNRPLRKENSITGQLIGQITQRLACGMQPHHWLGLHMWKMSKMIIGALL